MSLTFNPSPALTLGAELELQLLDKNSLNLRSATPELLRLLAGNEKIKSELYQSMIEITTGVCANALDLGQHLCAAMDQLRVHCEALGLAVVSAGTHPFANYEDGHIFPDERYRRLLSEQKWLARRLLIFGFHIHVGVRSGDHAIQMINALSQYLPLFLALSASSPFCRGENTKLASCRSTFFESLPTGGPAYQFDDWAGFNNVFASLVRAGSILSTRDLWWDIRPSPNLGTVEIRICDAPATISEAVAIAALIHLLCQREDRHLAAGREAKSPPQWLLRENKWRASRDGMSADFICDESGKTLPVREVLVNLIDELRDLVSANSYGPQMEILKSIMLFGSGSFRQRDVFAISNQGFELTIRSMIHELETGQPLWTHIRRTTCA
jgi:carboxylate-amine ligase